MMWLHLTSKATGDKQIVASLDGYDADLFEIVELDREPGEFDDFDGKALVANVKREADTLAGTEHIAEARLQKRIEATLIGSGIVLTSGLIFEEARLRGVEVTDLAADVIAKSVGFVDAEIARQAPDIAEMGREV